MSDGERVTCDCLIARYGTRGQEATAAEWLRGQDYNRALIAHYAPTILAPAENMLARSVFLALAVGGRSHH